ncbi:hypothetical protein SAMN05216602_4744 [Pseudomonas argentinensis]|uniref:Uncharacterized protein n=1 Tax=Phytopseudomonas argentinensis TaxID=289370 RepID=A0A1I3QEU5_9GAMM|nr:hypothetical protein SAMN05216602_4744 [Pseudomonas argentinensis]
MSAAKSILKQFNKAVAKLATTTATKPASKSTRPMLSTSWQNSS